MKNLLIALEILLDGNYTINNKPNEGIVSLSNKDYRNIEVSIEAYAKLGTLVALEKMFNARNIAKSDDIFRTMK